jgi:Zn-dependent oligopeptidase
VLAAAKYSHAAVFPIGAGRTLEDGSRQYPITAMVANLAKPTPEAPALMRHDDVVTFFHEMGHVFHGLLSKTRFQRFHGTRVARDFVEAPSQMLENWCWEPKVLEKMSSHYKTKEPLSPELVEKIIKRYVYLHISEGVCRLTLHFLAAATSMSDYSISASSSLPSLI